jgi:two-component system phosphate regulon sensor histidine kinase PhoR
MTVSLIGIISVQALWINHAIKTEQASFDKIVYEALKQGVKNVESDEMFMFMNERIELPEPPDIQFEHKYFDSISGEEVLMLMRNQKAPPPPHEHNFDYKNYDSLVKWHEKNVPKKQRRISSTVTTINDNGKNRIVIVNDTNFYDIAFDAAQSAKINIEYDYSDNEELEELTEQLALMEINEIEDIDKELIFFSEKMDSLEKVVILESEKEKIVEERLSKFQENIEKWVFEFNYDYDRFEYLSEEGDIDKIINEALVNNGIDLEYHFQLIKKIKDSSIIIKSVPDTNSVLAFKYKTELYPNDFFRGNTYLSLDFPHLNNKIYRAVGLPIIGSLIFTLIILITFGFTLYYIQKQKKISEIKTDFINNMTHEFKTPIATISLASSAIESPKVMGNKEKTSYYIDIIKKENKRMNSQVERVLQMAQIDNHDFNLNLQKLDVHEIIENVANILAIRAQDKGGKILTSLKATCFEIAVDEVHFANVLNNLIDNALKYNDKIPEILLETSIKNGRFILEVSDNGLGMNKEVQKHVFDKFYRKPSGNIHNIKGFGLGLSYVKAIVEAHGGDVSVNSEVGNGSRFTISLKC